jgi:hypothetical protein
MTDEETPDFEPDQSVDDEAPEADQPEASSEESFTDSFNPDELPEEAREGYEAAYKRLQADYTRKRQGDSQRVRELEEAVTRLSQAIPQDDDDADDEYDFDEDEYVDPEDRLDRIEQSLVARQEQERALALQEAEEEYVANQISDLEDRTDQEFSEQETEILFNLATSDAFRAEDGEPGIEAAYDLFEQIQKDAREKYVSSKKAPRIPSGQAAEKQYNLDTPEGRRDFMAATLQAEESAD